MMISNVYYLLLYPSEAILQRVYWDKYGQSSKVFNTKCAMLAIKMQCQHNLFMQVEYEAIYIKVLTRY